MEKEGYNYKVFYEKENGKGQKIIDGFTLPSDSNINIICYMG